MESTQDIWGQEVKVGDMVLKLSYDLHNYNKVFVVLKVLKIPRKGQVITDEGIYVPHTWHYEPRAVKLFIKWNGTEEEGRKISEKFLIYSQDFIETYVAKGLKLCDLYKDLEIDYSLDFLDGTSIKVNHSDGSKTLIY